MTKIRDDEEKHRNRNENSLKKRLSKYWHKKSAVMAFLLALAIMIIIGIMLKYPLIVRIPVLRFLLFSITMMLPTLIVSALTFPFKIGISKYTYFLVAFYIYFIIFYIILLYYSKQHSRQKRRQYIRRIIIYILTFVILSVLFLIKSFYG